MTLHMIICNEFSQYFTILNRIINMKLINEHNFGVGDGSQNAIGYQHPYKLGKISHNSHGF